MSSPHALEYARQRLVGVRHLSISRVLGAANVLVLRVDYGPGGPPDDIVQEIDWMAERMPAPPIEEGFSVRAAGFVSLDGDGDR